MMFSDFDSEVIGFDPATEREKVCNDSTSQTIPVKLSNEGTQTVKSNTKSTQVIQQELMNQNSCANYDANKLLTFLHKILPQLEEELNNFENNKNDLEIKKKDPIYFNQRVFGEKSESSQIFCEKILIKSDVFKKKVISDITWNATNALLAIACSERIHENWCNHETSIALYRNKKEEFEKATALQKLKVSSCVRCIQFHPFIPTLLAGGLCSGEVVIWDLTNGEMLLTRIKQEEDEDAHTDAVTNLVWRESNDITMLVTAGRDGKIILWRVAVTNLSFEVSERFLILKLNNTIMKNSLNEHFEISQIGFWAHKEHDFVVAAGENLFHCSLSTTKNLMSHPKYKDPVLMTYNQHEGIVTSVSCSLTSDLFMSSGVDGKVQINSFKMSSPMLVIHTNYPVLGIKWITDLCFLSWGVFSKIETYNFNVKSGTYSSAVICQVQEDVSKVAVNLSRQKKIAIGNTLGEVLLLYNFEF